MKMKTLALLLGTTIIATSQVDAMELENPACPTLSSALFARYTCPFAGEIRLPQGFEAMRYGRQEAESTFKGFCTNFAATISKGNDAYQGQSKSYPGRETSQTNGKLVCNYNLSKDWQDAAGIEKFSLTATVTRAAQFGATVCPKLTFQQMTDAMCLGTSGTKVVWGVNTSGLIGNACSLIKGALAKFGKAPDGVIKGNVDEGQFVAFTHTCEYKYHLMDAEMNLTLKGTMDRFLVKKSNDLYNKM